MPHIRRLFIYGALIISAFFALYVWQQKEQSHERIVNQLWHRTALLSEGTERALDNYGAILEQVGKDLVSMWALQNPKNGRAYIEEKAQSHKYAAGYALARPDGQMVLMSSNPNYDNLPNLMESPVTVDLFKAAIDTKQMQIGRPYKPRGFKQWIIPIRQPILGPDGEVVALALAALNLDGAGTIWSSILSRHETGIQRTSTFDDFGGNTRSLMFHEDGYLRYSGCKVTAESSRKIVYNTQVPPQLSAPDSFQNQMIGQVVRPPDWYIKNCSNQEQYRIIVHNYIPKYHLFIMSSYSYEAWKSSLIYSLIPEFTGYILLLLTLFVSYRFLQQRHTEFEAKTTYIARHDLLTGLPNKTQLLDRSEPTLSIAQRQNQLCAMLVIKIKNLGQVTRIYGQENADYCVETIAKRFKEHLRDEDTLARIGNNTFAAFFPHFSNETAPMDAAQRLITNLDAPIELDQGQQCALQCGKGIALYPLDARNADDLLGSASMACDAAKSNNSDGIVRYSAEFDTSATRQDLIVNEIPKAFINKEIVVYFQPKVGAKNGECKSFEALARWPHSRHGPIYPDEFIKVAEEAGLINILGDYLLDFALKELKALREETDKPYGVSVNVSAKQFFQRNFVETIRYALDRHALPASCLTIEITESIMIMDKALIARSLREIRSMGVGISIDDFGTGYSSLSYIHKLPITELKVDRSFITDMVNDEQNRALVKSIIALGKSLNVKTVAEGVETEEHVTLLQEFGCDELQGYFYSPPRPAHEMTKFLCKLQNA